MTSDNLLKFLGNREYLHQVSYQELKSMVAEYPYSLSLRYLLAMKSQQEDNTDLDRNIELLATYGIDRSHLHRIFSEDPIVLEDLEESIIMGEDFLELKELSSLERDLDEKLVVNEINDLNFLQEKKELAIPTPTQDSPPSVSESFEEDIDLAPELPIAEDDAPIPPTSSSSITDTGTSNNQASSNETKIPSIEEDALLTEEERLEEAAFEKALLEEEATLKKELLEKERLEEAAFEKALLEETLSAKELSKKEEEEEFITLDFEDTLVEEISGKAIAGNELAPSAAFTNNEIIEENSLPNDAVEINDLYLDKDKSELEEAPIKESEEEAIAEPAISDSKSFIENPADVLVEESEVALGETTVIETPVNSSVTQIENDASEPSEELSDTPIPFEVAFSESDPVTFESIQEGTEVILPEEPSELPQESSQEIIAVTPLPSTNSSTEIKEKIDSTIPAEATMEDTLPLQPTILDTPIIESTETEPEETTPVPTPAKAIFRFDSLDRLEASLNQPTNAIKPAPKAKFNSWQAQYSGVEQFSSIHIVPLKNGKGKSIKKKRRVRPKQFEETVAYAEESLQIDHALVSETLAQLLVKQGQYSKARTMYEQLCLIMPKKSGFFAGEIEKIQNLPDEDS